MSRPRRVLVIALAMSVLVGCSGGGTPATSVGPGVSREPAPSGFPLLGAWETTITREDLQAGGITDPGLLNENSGTFTWAFEADGTWRQVQLTLDGSPVVNPAFEGWYTVVEDGVIETVTEFPVDYAGDVVSFAYVVDGEAATFEVLDPPDDILPILTETHPWTRTSP